MTASKQTSGLLIPAPLTKRAFTAALFDDHPAARAGYAQLLAVDDIAVVLAEPLDIERAEERLAEVGEVDVALIATGGPDGEGLAFARSHARDPLHAPVVLLADAGGELDLSGVLANGAAGLVCRSCSTDRVVRALRAVATGGMSIECPGSPILPAPRMLSEKERRIVIEFARGASTEEVAASLWLSPHTVRTHMKNVQRKLEARTRTHAVAIAIAIGEVSLDPPAT